MMVLALDLGDDIVVNPLTETNKVGWSGDVLTASQDLGRVPNIDSAAVNSDEMGNVQPSAVGPSNFGANDGSTSNANPTDVMIVRGSFREVGITSEMIYNASWAEIHGYLQGMFDL